MPKCKNNQKKSYKGTEPSPKGKGWCAGGMEVGETKKGTDGNKWIVSADKNGNKRWAKVTKSPSTQKKTKKSATPTQPSPREPSFSWTRWLTFIPDMFFAAVLGDGGGPIDPSKNVYLTVTPEYWTGYFDKEFKLKKTDVSDSYVEKYYKKFILAEWEYLFLDHHTQVKLVKTEKKRNKIKFTLNYDIEGIKIGNELDLICEGLGDSTGAAAPFFKTIRKQKVHMYLGFPGITLCQ